MGRRIDAAGRGIPPQAAPDVMKLPLVLLFTVLSFSTAAAQESELYRVPIEARAELASLKLSPRHERIEGDYVVALTAAQVAHLERCGFWPEELERLIPVGGPPIDCYSSYAEIYADFRAYALAYPSIAEFVVMGQSVLGRDLFGLHISDNVQLEELEPEVVFWGGIHGDELAAAELGYLYAMDLLDLYAVDPDAKRFVDQNEIWVFPMLNPDGHEAFTRENANGVDLNREFGYNWDGWGGSQAPYSQPESRLVREFLLENNVTLSVTHHNAGALVLYPWGYSPLDVPDTDIIKAVGGQYSSVASYLLLQSWDDYETHGELIDDVYGLHGGLCYTTETAFPCTSFADSYIRNKAGMDAFCNIANGGLRGVVTDAQTGAPVWAAMWLVGNPFPSYTDPALGDVHRLVEPGSYDLVFWAPGYLPKTLAGVTVTSAFAASPAFGVALEQGGNGHAFQVTAANQKDPNNAYAIASVPGQALGPPDGQPVSLGTGGFIVLDMGAGHEITDGPGVDFTVTEALVPGDALPEPYLVYAGDAYETSSLVGAAAGTASFDLAASGLGSASYLKIVDQSTGHPDNAFAGLELDAVTVLNGTAPTALDVDVIAISLAAGGAQTFSLQGPTPNALYWSLGTTAGTATGQTLVPTALTIPLAPSPYFIYSLLHPNTVIVDSFAFLDAAGQETAVLTVPPGLDPAFAGIVFHHAYLLADPASFKATFVSNTTSLTLTP
jgi:hypothetical protein